MPFTPPAEDDDQPKSILDKLGAALPIALTALATVFAGLSTGELQKAMYWKSQAAQDQAKATNQWTLAGFKRSRALEMESAAAALRQASGYLRFKYGTAGEGATGLQPQAAEWLNGGGPPRVDLPPPSDDNLAQLIRDIRERKPEADLLALAARIPIKTINAAIDAGEEFVERTTTQEWDEVVGTAKAMVRKVVDEASRTNPADAIDPAKQSVASAAQALAFSMEDRRYRGEAGLNFALGYLYEARVKATSAESDKHRKKSENFFFAMLGCQIGATVAALALARKRGSMLWLLAGLAGLVAIVYGAFVFLDMQ